jgi:hypothetical protein
MNAASYRAYGAARQERHGPPSPHGEKLVDEGSDSNEPTKEGYDMRKSVELSVILANWVVPNDKIPTSWSEG